MYVKSTLSCCAPSSISPKRKATVAPGSGKGCLPSASDADVRHERKSSSKVFDGHKASVVVDMDSGLILGTDVLAGDAPDATRLLEQIETAEGNSGTQIHETVGECVDGDGETRREFAETVRALTARGPGESSRLGLFVKSHFVLHWKAPAMMAVTCPGNHNAHWRTTQWDGTLCRDPPAGLPGGLWAARLTPRNAGGWRSQGGRSRIAGPSPRGRHCARRRP